MRLTTEGGDHPVPASVAVGLHRILSEILTNVLKHASASEVRVTLTAESGNIRLEVSDNGVGFDDVAFTPGHGITNMTQRAEEMGGSFRTLSAAGAGTRTVVSLPVMKVSNGTDQADDRG